MSLAPPEVAIPSMEALVRMDYATVVPDIHVPVVAINADHGADRRCDAHPQVPARRSRP